MRHNLTIVTAFISGISKNPTKTIEKYIEYGQQLMRVKIPKIMY